MPRICQVTLSGSFQLACLEIRAQLPMSDEPVVQDENKTSRDNNETPATFTCQMHPKVHVTIISKQLHVAFASYLTEF